MVPGELMAKIEDDTDARRLFEGSLREVVDVLRKFIPEYTLEMARNGVMTNLKFKANAVMKLSRDLLLGDIPDTRYSTDWLIKQAKIHNVDM